MPERAREQAEEWLAAGLCLARAREDVARAAPWLVAAQSEIGPLPPAGVIADLGRLLTVGPRARAGEAAPPAGDLKLRAAVRAYEDGVLGRLAAEPRLEAAADAVARLPASLQAEAIAVLAARLLSRIRYAGGTSITPAAARRLAERSAREVLEAGWARLADAEVSAGLAAGYDELVKASRHAGALIGDAEVFTLENLAVLRDLGQRLAIEQVVEASAELARVLPRRMKRRAQNGRIPTAVEDEDQYPIGGFSSMSTSGTIENLVSSELIYMEDGEPSAEEVDLFTLRYVEGELLYYTRDESVFVRGRREIEFVLHPDLVAARFKDRGWKWQRLVTALGTILALVRRLSEWLQEEALLFRVTFLADPALHATPLAAEQALCTLLLREWIDKGMAEVGEAAALDDALVAARGRAKHASVDVVSIACGASPAAVAGSGAGDARVRRHHLDLSTARPRVGGADATGDEDDDVASAWSTATIALARALA